ncbi:DUF1565 domain-containing protein [Leptolyngbya sp. FACHB-261]|uniref:DUF1565 domain-containing protein n=1 Tax=Leptolyngbya sp. FACHB-261 TaxID=2692806 RepID=UPI001683C3BA|nr:DUF1565 domain-containing protein [Leptolyngbya sp. FACHB-261]MBD2100218.1 DUF1565 domain-containing protein [Leptolyngbya sp. FACHB-261]
MRREIACTAGWIWILLASCTPRGELTSTTTCDAATALATYTWRVEYYTDRNSGKQNASRTEDFARISLLNRNAERPQGAVTGPDDEGVWWPELPPRPSAEVMDQELRAQEQHEPPSLQRSVDYRLSCTDGELSTDARTYRQAAKSLRAAETVQARYSLDRILALESPAAGDIAGTSPDDTNQGNDDGNNTGPDNSGPNNDNSRTNSSRSRADAPNAQPSTLYVDISNGSDQGDGTEQQPLKTITQALGQAKAGTTIQLAPGTYSPDTGEMFPLQLKSGVTLRGDEAFRGKGFVITGGGRFLSPTWARQNITVLAVEGSKLLGVTLSNPNTRGSAVWVETGSPVLERNTFTGSHREGVFVSGNATPTLKSNTFEDNGGNGVSFTRDSGGLMTGNLVRNTGFGVAIGDQAAPKLINNQILKNRDGVVISGEAQPSLSQNTVADNERDGIVVTNSAQPQLQQNRLSQNGQYDLNNNTGTALSMDGTELSGLKVQGPVN